MTTCPRAGQTGTVLQMGIFIAFGLNDLQNGKPTKALTEQDYSQYMAAEMNHVYTIAVGANSRVHELIAGVKVAVLFLVATGKQKFDCHCVK